MTTGCFFRSRHASWLGHRLLPTGRVLRCSETIRDDWMANSEPTGEGSVTSCFSFQPKPGMHSHASMHTVYVGRPGTHDLVVMVKGGGTSGLCCEHRLLAVYHTWAKERHVGHTVYRQLQQCSKQHRLRLRSRLTSGFPLRRHPAAQLPNQLHAAAAARFWAVCAATTAFYIPYSY